MNLDGAFVSLLFFLLSPTRAISHRLWRELTSALDARDMVAATAAKTAVEDAQRSLRQDREAKGENFVPRFFELREGRWQPKLV